jgi:Fe-S-cluster-containing dehydrogenase component
MHCAEPSCASVCPAEAIDVDAHGVVLSAAAERCIGCGNCALACPFGVPKIDPARELMTKCDLCYDRTSVGRAPMCATVCPSGALFYGTREEVEDLRRARPVDVFEIGGHELKTLNHVMAPATTERVALDGEAAPQRSRAERLLEEALCEI